MSIAEDTRMSAAAEMTNDFEYTPMSPLAPISVILCLLGLTAFMGFYGIFVALIASMVSLVAVRKIGATEGELGGLGMARTALVVSGLTVVASSVLLVIAYSTECPEGYERHNFPREISDYEFIYPGGQRQIPPEVEPILNKKVFIKGFVYHTRTTQNQREFILLKDQGDCCFGGDPAPHDMIHIKLSEDHESVNFPMLTMVSVAGVIEADPTAPPGQAVYEMEADQCEYSRTSF
ncbi:MAG: DUF3299 domain-containing protein [Planctomycetaceae bacterium]